VAVPLVWSAGLRVVIFLDSVFFEPEPSPPFLEEDFVPEACEPAFFFVDDLPTEALPSDFADVDLPEPVFLEGGPSAAVLLRERGEAAARPALPALVMIAATR
jgi:hypothetical protein